MPKRRFGRYGDLTAPQTPLQLSPPQSRRLAAEEMLKTTPGLAEELKRTHLSASSGSERTHDLTSEELRRILAYYESPIGQKDVVAQRVAMQAFMRHLAVEGEKLMEMATASYIEELKAIAAKARGEGS